MDLNSWRKNAEYDEEDMVSCNHCWDEIGNEKEVYGDETVDYEMANGELVCIPCYKIWMKEYKNDLDPHYSPFYAETFEARTHRKSYDWENRKFVKRPDGKHNSGQLRGYDHSPKGTSDSKLDWDSANMANTRIKANLQGKEDLRNSKKNAETFEAEGNEKLLEQIKNDMKSFLNKLSKKEYVRHPRITIKTGYTDRDGVELSATGIGSWEVADDEAYRDDKEIWDKESYEFYVNLFEEWAKGYNWYEQVNLEIDTGYKNSAYFWITLKPLTQPKRKSMDWSSYAGWGAESFDVEFNEWADQELMSHGKDISFKDWAQDEGMKHGNTEITEWAQHEDESHDARYGAESETLTPYDFNTTASRRFGEQDGKVWTHADNWKVKPNGEDNLWLYDKITKWCNYWEGKGYDFVVKSVNGKIVGVIPSNQMLKSLKYGLRPYRVGNDFVKERSYVKITIEDDDLNIHSERGYDGAPSNDITFRFVTTTRGLSVYGAETFEDCEVCYATVDKGTLNDVQAGRICNECHKMNQYDAETFEAKGYAPDKPFYATTHENGYTTVMHPIKCGHYKMVMNGTGVWMPPTFYDTIEEMFTTEFDNIMDSQYEGMVEWAMSDPSGKETIRKYKDIKTIGDARKFAKKHFDFKIDFAPCFRKERNYDSKALNALPITVHPFWIDDGGWADEYSDALREFQAERKKRSSLLSEPFEGTSLDSGDWKGIIVGFGIGLLGLFGYSKLRK